jgi:serine phosphatase RsbU (regulator of sigma subunit)
MPRARIAIASTHKYASRESGDTVEIAERPTGGYSVVLIDGQGSGSAAKTISMFVASRALSMLRDGARDTAVASACHDFLYAYRHGKVSASLDIVTVDLRSSTLAVTRNNPVPFITCIGSQCAASDCIADPIGIHRSTQPARAEFPLSAGTRMFIFSDGVANAGQYSGLQFDPACWANGQDDGDTDASEFADRLLAAAMTADGGRPRDDMTVVALAIDTALSEGSVRRMSVEVPLAV